MGVDAGGARVIDVARALSFGADPERYDRTRPRYPRALVDDLLGGATPRVLDIGCGTGIAAEHFLAAGCEVVGVEPDSRMAAVAATKGIQVEVASFETWDAAGRRFELLTCGQAWHWVDQSVGWAKAASVLAPGGRLAIFWNLGEHDDETQAALDEAYARHAPALVRNSVVLGRVQADLAGSDAAAVDKTGLFDPPEVRRYAWTARYSTDAWVAMLSTHSDHRLLEPAALSGLLDAVAQVIDAAGGELQLTYDTLLVVATRRDG
jgi:SAM-dependent methyltransferase